MPSTQPHAADTDAPATDNRDGTRLFFRRWLANPLQMGSIVPSSADLCRRVAAAATWGPDEAVIELGAGTGVVSRALLAAGLPPERLFVIEIVPGMAAHLSATLPGAHVIAGDALALPDLIPAAWHGRIGTVICGIPMLLLSRADQRRLVAAIETVAPGRGFLHFSYCVISPIPHQALGLTATRVAWTPQNFPPASVWGFTPRAAKDRTR